MVKKRKNIKFVCAKPTKYSINTYEERKRLNPQWCRLLLAMVMKNPEVVWTDVAF